MDDRPEIPAAPVADPAPVAGADDAASEPPAGPSTRAVRSPGVRARYMIIGGLTGAALVFAAGMIVLLLLSSLRTITEITQPEIQVLIGVGLVVGLARGSAVSTRLSRGDLLVTNPWRSYRVRAEEISKLVSIPSGSGGRPTLGLLRSRGSVELPIRALALPAATARLDPASPAAGAFADIAGWAAGHEIPFRASSAAWNALLEQQARRA